MYSTPDGKLFAVVHDAIRWKASALTTGVAIMDPMSVASGMIFLKGMQGIVVIRGLFISLYKGLHKL